MMVEWLAGMKVDQMVEKKDLKWVDLMAVQKVEMLVASRESQKVGM